MRWFVCGLCGFGGNSLLWGAEREGEWSTYRGNAQRTGNVDGLHGPAAPKVLWVLKSQDHFVASPVPFGDRVFIAGLGGFNAPAFHCLFSDPKAPQTPP